MSFSNPALETMFGANSIYDEGERNKYIPMWEGTRLQYFSRFLDDWIDIEEIRMYPDGFRMSFTYHGSEKEMWSATLFVPMSHLEDMQLQLIPRTNLGYLTIKT